MKDVSTIYTAKAVSVAVADTINTIPIQIFTETTTKIAFTIAGPTS